MLDLMSPPLLIFKVTSQIIPLAHMYMHSVFLFFSLMRTWPEVLHHSFSHQSEAVASHTDSTFNKFQMSPTSRLFCWKEAIWAKHLPKYTPTHIPFFLLYLIQFFVLLHFLGVSVCYDFLQPVLFYLQIVHILLGLLGLLLHLLKLSLQEAWGRERTGPFK